MRRFTMRTAVVAAALTLLPVLAPTSNQASAAVAPAAVHSTGAVRAAQATPETAAEAPVRYAALGDSYSSGEGNPPFDPDSGDCHRSRAAWPRMIARQDPEIVMAAHIACSGATSTSLRRRYNGEPPQLRQLRNLAEPVDLVTITIGGNDIGFGPVLADCFVSDCVLDGALRRARVRIEDELPAALARDYRGLQRAAPDANIVVVGYPRLFPSRARRTGCLWLSEPERRTLNRLATLLDRTIADSAEQAGLDYVSVLRSLRNHELCTRNSWIYPIGPFGGQLRGHPTRPGQRAIAAVVRPRLDALL
ncbi:MAG TPA: SGNH/GDSL hydrolase family protein [Actinomycetales bacterium]|nr:SGNH/GDSL hydrolase family protein [Actinomycetales bacterium]